MARSVLLASTVLSGALLVFVAGYVSMGRRRAAPLVTLGTAVRERVEPRVTGRLVAGLLLAFVVLGAGVSAGVAADAGAIALFVGVMAGLLGMYLIWGVYHIARVRGMQHAQAVGVGAWFLGILFLTAVVARLFVG